MAGHDISVGQSEAGVIDRSAGSSQWMTSKHVGCVTESRPRELTYQKIESIFVKKPNQAIFEECGQSII